MKRRLDYSNEAVADLADAKAYTQRVWGHVQAKHYVSGLLAEIRTLRMNALRYPLCGAVQPGLRRKRSAMHHIYFLAFADRVEIVRIMHVSRDPGSQLDLAVEAEAENLRLHEDRLTFEPQLLEELAKGLASPLVEFDPRLWINEHYPE